jgi:hypothetical protein
MLEAAVALQLARGKGVEAAIIAVPLLFNPAHDYIEERHARATLADLKSRPALTRSCAATPGGAGSQRQIW